MSVSVPVIQTRLERLVSTTRATAAVFREVNAKPELLPPWPATGLGRMAWRSAIHLWRWLAMVTAAGLGAILGTDLSKSTVSFGNDFGLLAVVGIPVVAIALMGRLVGMVRQVLVYAGEDRHAHGVSRDHIDWIIGVVVVLATVAIAGVIQAIQG